MTRTFGLCLAGVLSVLLSLELLCRVLPVSTSTETGYYTDPLILTYPARHRWVAATGWDLRNAQTLQANNLGYAADRDFVLNERAVALIGDSYVEASMLPAAARPGAQLERLLGSRPVYAMGAPGTALLDYAERIRYAHEKLGVRDFVILMERGDVKQSLCGSGNVKGPCLDPKTLVPRVETLSPPGVAKRLLRQSALAQYLISQLRVTPQALLDQLKPKWLLTPHAVAQPAAQAPSTPVWSDNTKREIDAVATAFFERIKPHVRGQLVVVVDGVRVLKPNRPRESDPARQYFINLARAAGAVVVDAEPVFAQHMATSPLKLQVGPYDGHLNALGVGLVVKAAAQALDAKRDLK